MRNLTAIKNKAINCSDIIQDLIAFSNYLRKSAEYNLNKLTFTFKAWLSILFISLLSSCTTDNINVIDDNDPISVTNISRLKIENYVNRLFIDLIGREPLKVELGPEVDTLKVRELSRDSRLDLINRLMQDTSFRIGERSYKAAFYLNLYNLAKVRCLEGVSDEEISYYMGLFLSDAMRDSMNGNWDDFYGKLNQIRKLQNVLQSQADLYNGDISYNQIFQFLVDNHIYGIINMNNIFFKFSMLLVFENGS